MVRSWFVIFNSEKVFFNPLPLISHFATSPFPTPKVIHEIVTWIERDNVLHECLHRSRKNLGSCKLPDIALTKRLEPKGIVNKFMGARVNDVDIH